MLRRGRNLQSGGSDGAKRRPSGPAGVPSDRVQETLPFKYVVHNEIAIFGSRANPNVSHKVIQLISSGQLQVSDLITHAFPLTAFTEALDTFTSRRDRAIKVVIEPNETSNK